MKEKPLIVQYLFAIIKSCISVVNIGNYCSKSINSIRIRKMGKNEDVAIELEEKYPGFKGKFSEFLSLENISYKNKRLLIYSFVPIEIIRDWTIGCAGDAAKEYLKKYPYNESLTLYVQSLKEYFDDKIDSGKIFYSSKTNNSFYQIIEEQKMQNIDNLILLLKKKGL